MTNIKKDIFKIMQEEKDQYDLYTRLCDYVSEIIFKTKGEENAEFYETLRLLSNSINNAGCEERRGEQIDLINREMNDIADDYDDFLP